MLGLEGRLKYFDFKAVVGVCIGGVQGVQFIYIYILKLCVHKKLYGFFYD